jgi:stromal membrane-associated protein
MDRKSGLASQHLMANLRAAPAVPRPRSTPPINSVQIERQTSPGPPLPPKTPENLPSRLRPLATTPSLSQNAPPPTRSISHPLPPLTISDKFTVVPPLRHPAAAQPSIQKPAGQVWEDLISLQGPSQSSSLPLQYSPVSPMTPFPSQPQVPVQQHPTTLGNASNPFMHLSLGQANATASLVASPISVSTPGPQFPFVPSAPLPSPALHLGATNPFNQSPFAASMNGTAFSTSSNPFSSSPMSVSIATFTPSAQPVMALPTGGLLHTPPIPYVPSQTSAPTPTLSFPPTPFGPAGPAPNPFAPVSFPGQMPLSASGATNPFSAMQMGQAGFSGVTPQATFRTTAFLSQQQQQQPLGPNGFGGWAGQGAQGSF